MNYYQFHVGDYRSGTMHLSDAEDLAYRRALDWYYDTEKPIPLETEWVSRRLRVDKQVLEIVLRDFFVETPEGWRHERCDAEIAEYQQRVEKNRRNGSKGGRPTKKNSEKKNPLGSESDSDGLAVATDWKGNQEPITNNQEPKERSKPLSGKPDIADENQPTKWTPGDSELAEWMLGCVQEVSPSTKGAKSWADEIRLMRERDKRTHTEIRAMFEWAHNDAFWRANILSPSKLRQKWPQLEAKRGNPTRQSPHSGFGNQDYSAGIGKDGRF